AVGRTADARSVWERLDPGTRARGRFRLTEAGLLLAEGRREQARAVFDEGFEVADLREGDEVIGRLWGALTDEPLPEHYDFRMRPPSWRQVPDGRFRRRAVVTGRVPGGPAAGRGQDRRSAYS